MIGKKISFDPSFVLLGSIRTVENFPKSVNIKGGGFLVLRIPSESNMQTLLSISNKTPIVNDQPAIGPPNHETKLPIARSKAIEATPEPMQLSPSVKNPGSRDYTQILPNGAQKPAKIFSFSWRFFSPQFMTLIPQEWTRLWKNRSNSTGSSSSASSSQYSNSDIIVTSDLGCQRVLLIETARGTIHSIIGGKSGAKQGELNNPKGVAVTKYRSSTNLERVAVIVADANNNRVQTFDAETGDFLNMFANKRYLKQPFAVTVNQNEQIIVANIDTNCVTIHKGYSSSGDNETFGTLLKVIGTSDGLKLKSPHGLTVNSRGELIISSDHKIDILDRKHSLIKSFGSQGKDNNEFNQPLGVCVDRHDNIFVANYDDHNVKIFNSEGQWLRTFGKRGSGSGSSGNFFYLYDVLVDSENNIFVADGGNRRICMF
eukprot:TRINITY_DN5646_c0_g2_i4.p1 TRINITY_DN5646_c0_g2~~TRINITY_DN5646_c0_g2_i4.p1  ORF type:complete len:429 (+),score=68.50 TRINITY_DN5646_c0_g2_i4:985-2271(+)